MKRKRIQYSLTTLMVAMLMAMPCYAQSSERPSPAAEVFAGHGGFLDDSVIPHTVLGGAARFYLTRRIGVGPEFVYMWGPRFDRDLFLTGNMTWDVLSPRATNPRAVSPFVVVGAGLFRHIGEFRSGSQWGFTTGGGTRVRINDRLYSVVDFRMGWELHYRITGGIGVNLSK